ncbi:MAG: flavocytochrome c [Deltaproteobacteria bacterium]|nr:flavocytochrome c [Deltaproteobacteria bacterium]
MGSGFAGLAAAIEAGNAGASVIILEKMKGRGGNSVISDGLVAAAGSVLQIEHGIEDTPQDMFDDMLKAGLGLNHPELVQLLVEKSAVTLQWTMDEIGVQYQQKVTQLGGHSRPRSHTTSTQSGSVIIRQMLAKIKAQGMTVRSQAYFERFIQDNTGAIIGVKIRDGYQFSETQSGKVKFIKAAKAVVLATGGFANDVDFRSVQDPRLDREIDSTNKRATTAEALKEALRIGAAPVHLSLIQLGPWASPDEKMYGFGPLFASYIAMPYGIMVDPATGKRFVNELADRRIRADAILNLGKPCIGIADSQGVHVSGQKIGKCLKRRVVKSFEDLTQLAQNYGIPEKALQQTVQEYNTYVLQKQDKAFEKPILEGTQPLVEAPFYGIRMWPKVHHTMGGIRINTHAQVINLDGHPIEGLFAAGEVTGGIHGACRLGSCAITDCLVFGRIAGKNAAARLIS